MSIIKIKWYQGWESPSHYIIDRQEDIFHDTCEDITLHEAKQFNRRLFTIVPITRVLSCSTALRFYADVVEVPQTRSIGNWSKRDATEDMTGAMLPITANVTSILARYASRALNIAKTTEGKHEQTAIDVEMKRSF